MSAPTLLRLAFDSGWSHGGRHGDPGDGRLRFDTPQIAKASNLCINARDAQEAVLDELIPTWRIGDVMVIERPGAEGNRVVVWIIGPIVHMGPFYRVPIIVRTFNGAFAAHDELVLHHHRNVTEVDGVSEPAGKPNSVTAQPNSVSALALQALPPAAATGTALTPIAPMALTAAPPENTVISNTSAPVAPVASAFPADQITAEVEKLRADNGALHDLLAGLLSDETELYAVEHA